MKRKSIAMGISMGMAVGVVMLVIGFTFDALGVVPDLVPVQGVLADDMGDPVDGAVDITFSIYAEESVEDALWEDTFSDIDVDGGFFSIYLGSNIPLEFSSLVLNDQLWLGISIGADDEMPRVRLMAVPFAIEAQVCRRVGSLSEADINHNFMPSNYVPDWSELSNVPSGFADGVDHGFATEHELVALLDDNYATVIHSHDTDYLPSDYVVDWTTLANVPDGFADGVDDGYTSKTELTGLLDDNYIRNQTGTTQSAGFQISGSGRVGSLYVDGSIAIDNGAARIVSCPSGMNYVETNLCIDASARSAQYYWVEAVSVCRRSGYHMCTYSELDQVLCHENLYSVVYNPNGRWIGNFVGDDTVLCGNANITGTGCQSNFDGHCNKNTTSPGRQYWCCLSLGNTQ